MNKQKNLRLSVIVTYLQDVVRILVGLVNVPILTAAIGKSEYGLYSIVGSLFSYVSILEASLSAGTLRYYCLAGPGENRTEKENVLGVCRRIYRLLSALLLAAAPLVILAFRSFYADSMTPAELTEGSWMLALQFAGLIVTMLNAVYLAGLNGNEEYVFLKLTSAASLLLQPVAYYAATRRLPCALTAVCVHLALNILVALTRYLYANRALGIRAVVHQKDRRMERAVLAFAGSILLSQIADQIFWKTDQIILAKMYDTALVAVYSIAASVYLNYMVLGTVAATVFFPRVSRYYQEAGGMEKISDLFIRVGRISFLLCGLLLSGFIIFGREFLFLWVGEGFRDAYGMALLIMVPFTVDICQNLGLTILQVTDQYSFRAKMYFLAAVLNIVSTVVLAYFFGGYGAALSTGATMTVTSGVILNVFYAKKVRLDIQGYWKNIGQIFLRLLPLAVLAFIGNQLLGIRWSVVGFAAKAVVFTALYGTAAYFFAMNAEEKQMVGAALLKLKTAAARLFGRR